MANTTAFAFVVQWQIQLPSVETDLREVGRCADIVRELQQLLQGGPQPFSLNPYLTLPAVAFAVDGKRDYNVAADLGECRQMCIDSLQTAAAAPGWASAFLSQPLLDIA